MAATRRDLLVVGGGPVGLFTALRAHQAGLDVEVVEARAGVIDKACGEGLLPPALDLLATVGVHPAGQAIRGFRYSDGRRSAEHRFDGAPGRGVRRTDLHDALSRRILELEIPLRQERVTSLAQDAMSVRAGGVSARSLIACDGLHSSVSRMLELDRRPAGRARFGLRRHFAVAPWSDLVEVHWGRHVEAYVTPIGEEVIGVAVLGPRGTVFEDAIAALPELADRLRDAEPVSSLRGAGPFGRRTKRRVHGLVLLAGDASGYDDALTGEGLRVGLEQAEAAVRAVAEGRPHAYEREWLQITRSFRRITRGLVAVANSPLRPGIVPVAASFPRLFGAAVDHLVR